MNKLIFNLLSWILSIVLFTGCTSGSRTIETLDDLKGLNVGVPRGTTHETYMTKHSEAILKSYDSTMDAIAALRLGRVSATVTNKAVATVVTKQDSSLDIIPIKIGSDPVAIAIRKGNQSLKDSINLILSSLKAEGSLADMESRWLSAPDAYPPISIGLPTDGEPLRIAVSASREPFCFKDKDGNLCGFDVELAYRIAERLKRPLQFKDMVFSTLVASLQAGRADVIISLMNYTPDRAQIVDFSIPYFESERVMLRKK